MPVWRRCSSSETPDELQRHTAAQTNCLHVTNVSAAPGWGGFSACKIFFSSEGHHICRFLNLFFFPWNLATTGFHRLAQMC